MSYRLLGLSQSGNTFKVAFALQALGLVWEPVFVDYIGGVTRTPTWREQNSVMGELPILEDGALRLTQSAVILLHLAEKHGGLGGHNPSEKQEILRWLFFDNHKFTSYLATYRYNKSFSASAPDPAVMTWLRGRMDNAFGIVDKHLTGRSYLAGSSATIADISLCGYLFYPVEQTGYPVAQRFPALAAWVERMRQLPGWADPYDILPGERIAPQSWPTPG
jgi:glutathione S-transferase